MPSNRITTFNARRAARTNSSATGNRSSNSSRRQQHQRPQVQAPQGAPTAPRAHLEAERQLQQGSQEQQQPSRSVQAPPQHHQVRSQQPRSPTQPTAPRQQQRPAQPSQQAHNGQQQQQQRRRRVSPPPGLRCPRAAFTPGFRGLSQEAIDRYKYTSEHPVELFPRLELGGSGSLIFIRPGEGTSAEQKESSNVRGAATGPTFCSGPTTDSTDSDGSSQGSFSSAPATTPPGTTPSPPPASLNNHGITDRVNDGSPRIPVIRIVDPDDQAAAVEGPFEQAPTHPATPAMPAWVVDHWLPSWPRSKLYMESEPYNPKTDATKYRAPIGRRGRY